jgi:hypothetical protein
LAWPYLFVIVGETLNQLHKQGTTLYIIFNVTMITL